MPNANDQSFLDAVNAARLEKGIAPLEFSEPLATAASLHSADMVARDYFAHIAPEPSPNGKFPRDRMEAAGIVSTGGDQNENIAAGGATAMDTFTQWKNSPGHWETLMKPSYRYIGLGRDGNTWTANFAKDVVTSGPVQPEPEPEPDPVEPELEDPEPETDPVPQGPDGQTWTGGAQIPEGTKPPGSKPPPPVTVPVTPPPPPPVCCPVQPPSCTYMMCNDRCVYRCN